MLPSMPALFMCPPEQMCTENQQDETPERPKQNTEQGLNVLNPVIEKETLNDNKEEVVNPSHSSNGNDVQEQLKIQSSEKEFEDEVCTLSPHSEKHKLLQGSLARKKRKLDYVTTTSATELGEAWFGNEKFQLLAEAYFTKAKCSLDSESFNKFVCTLVTFDTESGSVISLYKDVSNILQNYRDLSYEFTSFLLPHQTLECKKFTDLIYFQKSWAFLKKVDSLHLNKIINILEQLASNPSTSLEVVRSSIFPVLKGHPNLINAFIELLPQEKTTPSPLVDFEEIRDYSGNDSEWERIRILVHPDRACGNSCSCLCHYSSKSLCTFCNIKFSNGHVYVQYGKTLRFAKVDFSDSSSEYILKRLHPTLCDGPFTKKKCVQSPKGTGSLTTGDHPDITKAHTDLSGMDDDIADEDILIKQESDVFNYYDLADYNEDDVIVVEDDDDYFEDDDKLSEMSSGEGEKSLDSVTGDFAFDDLADNENDEDDDVLKDISFNDSSCEIPNQKMEVDEDEADGVKTPNKLGYPNKGTGNSIEIELSTCDNVSKMDDFIKDENLVSKCDDSKLSQNKLKQEVSDSSGIGNKDMLVKPKDCFCDKTPSEVSNEVEVTSSVLETNLTSPPNSDIKPVETHKESNKSDVHYGSDSKSDCVNIEAELGSEDMEGEEKNNADWTRAEDKVILEAFQKELDTEHTFSKISCLMPTRSVHEIQGRFQVLMKLLEKVASETQNQ